MLYRNILALFALFLITSCTDTGPQGPVIFAASSLQRPLEALSDKWAEQGGDRPQLVFASSAALARQIENGSLADIFISADPQWTDYIIAVGKLDHRSVRTIATNQLVIARSTRNAPLQATGEQAAKVALATAGIIATGDPDTVPLGRYARQAFSANGQWDRLTNRIAPAPSSSAALRLVLLEEADIGVLYASDAHSRNGLGVIWPIPPNTHDPIRYMAIKLPASSHPDAEKFLNFLVTPEAQQLFEHMGYMHP